MSTFYNRDNNITGAQLLTGLSFDPNYGSNVAFSTKSSYISYSDKVANIVPMGMNNVVGDYSLNFSLRKNDAQNLINFYELQSGTGVIALTDNSNIYRTQSGVISSIDSFTSENNDKFNIGLKFSVERNSSVLNWSGQSFVNYQFQRWETGVSYGAYDCVYFENDQEEPINNFFYCLADHNSSFSNNPLSTGQKWTTSLFLDSNDQFIVQQTPSVSVNDFKGSFLQRINDQKNLHSLDKIEISYKNISDKKAKSLLHFLESRAGSKKFSYSFPEIYDRPKVFFAPQWEHQWNFKDSNNIKITAAEDPLGLLFSGAPTASFVQETGYLSVNFSYSGSDRMFFDTGNGKELLSGSNKTLTWPDNTHKRNFKLWGRFSSLRTDSQGLTSAKFGVSKGLSGLYLSGNSLSGIKLNDVLDLQHLECQNNRLANLELGNKTGLSYVNCSNNGINYLNIGGTQLTGLYCQNNSLPALYVDSCLSGLNANGWNSGVANFSGNSGISESSLATIASLTGKSWSIGHEYTAPPAETPDNFPSVSPSFPTGSSNIVAVDDSHDGSCSLLETIECISDQVFNSSTKFHFPNETDIAQFAIGEQFYVQNNNKVMIVTKICCDLAEYVSGPTDCAYSPSIVISSPSNSVGSFGSVASLSFSMATVGSMVSVSL